MWMKSSYLSRSLQTFSLRGGVMKRVLGFVVVLASGITLATSPACGQGYGTDFQNVFSPAAGGMAGVSIVAPQDVPAAVFGNPASLSQFEGTQFTIGGGWGEGYPTINRDGVLEGTPPYSVTSRTQGFVNPEIAMSQDLRSLGVPGTMGLGLTCVSGGGAEYRGLAPAGSVANNFSTEMLVLGVNAGVGLDVTDRLSAGATLTLGTGFEQLGLVDNSAMVHAYGLRGTLGGNYKLNDCNTVGAFYQTKMGFNFPNAVYITSLGSYRNISMEQPETVGFGIANRRFLDGNLLIAADIYYKLWENADLYRDIYVNQWVFAFGTQLTRGKMKYRLGYSYNTNPTNHNVGSQLSGLPLSQSLVQFYQASETAAITQHRFTAGFGRQGFLFENVDLDFYAGGMFPASDTFGEHTSASVAVYYLGMGLTWRFGVPVCSECTGAEFLPQNQ